MNTYSFIVLILILCSLFTSVNSQGNAMTDVNTHIIFGCCDVFILSKCVTIVELALIAIYVLLVEFIFGVFGILFVVLILALILLVELFGIHFKHYEATLFSCFYRGFTVLCTIVAILFKLTVKVDGFEKVEVRFPW